MNGYLSETVYMKQPEGFVHPTKRNYVCKLSKALYGLKQAPRAWYDRLRDTLLAWKFKNCRADSSLFFYKDSTQVLILLIYVDDILVTGTNPDNITIFTTKLNDIFALKDLGPIHYFLGFEIFRDTKGFVLSQTKYVTDLLSRCGIYA